MEEAVVAISLTQVNEIAVFGSLGVLLMSKRGDWVNEVAIWLTQVIQIAKRVVGH